MRITVFPAQACMFNCNLCAAHLLCKAPAEGLWLLIAVAELRTDKDETPALDMRV